MFSDFERDKWDSRSITDKDFYSDEFPRYRTKSISTLESELKNNFRTRRCSETGSPYFNHTPSLYSPNIEYMYPRARKYSSSSSSDAGNIEGSIPIPRQRYNSGQFFMKANGKNSDKFNLAHYPLCHSMSDLNLDESNHYNYNDQTITRPKSCNTLTKWTQTPPLEQVLLEMRMERDMRGEYTILCKFLIVLVR